jgi:type II secretory pathway pseudopilin PulG
MKKPIQKKSNKRYTIKGFTLVELMVAMGIAIVIMSMLVGITNVAMGAWQRSRAEVRASRQAKAMLDVMARDLESIVIRSGNINEWLYCKTVDNLPGTDREKSTNAAELIFFTSATDRYQGALGTPKDLGGDVCAVSYKLAFQDPLDASENPTSTFVFYRQLVDPKPTFDSLLAKPDLEQAFTAVGGNNRFETATSNSSSTDSQYNFVCENVYQYSITFRVDVSDPATVGSFIKPVRVTLGESGSANEFRIYGDRIDTDGSPASGAMSVTNAQLQSGKVTGCEISITVLSDTGINQLKTRTFTDDKAKAKFLQEHSYEFTKSVDLPGL